jgi:dipeptide transport system substrate-binding protein
MRSIIATLAFSVALWQAGIAASAKTLVYCAEAAPDSFDPAIAAGVRDASSTAIYNRLVDFEPGTTVPVPSLAESWDISADGLEYVFKLRQGVTFHSNEQFKPSRPFNADDVIFSFDRQMNPQNPYNAYAGRPYGYFEGSGLPKIIGGWEKIDDYTLRLRLNKRFSPLIASLAMDFGSIMSKEYADQLQQQNRMTDLGSQPVGTGPFRIVDYQQDAAIRYEPNGSYWKSGPKISELVFAITPDANIRWQKILAGECHAMAYPNPADIELMKKAPGVTVMEKEGLNTGYLAFNTQQKPFDNPAVRKALVKAIDRKAIVEAVFGGRAVAAKNPLPPGSWAYNEEIVDFPFDPDAARRELADAGVTGLRMKIWAMPVQRPYNPNARRMAEMMQSDLSKVGVEAEIVTYEWAEYLSRSRDVERDGALMFGFTGDNGDPDNFLSVPLGCAGVPATNRANWCNEKFDALLSKASATYDREERARLYREAQTIFHGEMPWIPVAHSLVTIVLSNRVSGYVMDAFDRKDFSQVDLSD